MFRSNLAIALLFSLPLAGACTGVDDTEVDEFAGESDADGEAGKADAVSSDTFTYFEIRRDYRRCVSPLCGGFWVSRVNHAKTTCANGSKKSECYVAELDSSALGFNEDNLGVLWSGIESQKVLLRGDIEDARFGSFGNLGRFAATEAWHAGLDSSPDGVFVRVKQNGVRCFAAPCADKTEDKLNSVLTANISELDFEPSGANEDEQSKALGELTSSGGLIVAGRRYTDRVDGRTAKARTVTQFWTQLVPSGSPTQGDCFVGGCSGQVCSENEGVITTCEWQDSYACYDTATCERQAGGECGWTETPELDACLAGSL